MSFSLVLVALAQDWYVDGSAPSCPAGSGTELDPFCAIMDAVAAASDGDTIHIAPGNYVENLVLDEDLTLVGTGGSQVTILDGAASGSVVRVTDASVALVRLTLTNGTGTLADGTTHGGGLSVDSIVSPASGRSAASATLTECEVTGNVAGDGGGIAIRNYGGSLATLVLDDSTVSGNLASYGGGIAGLGYCNVILNDSELSGNSAGTGGGVAAGPGCQVYASRTLVSANHAEWGGGAALTTCSGSIVCGSGTMFLVSSTVTANTASSAGAGIVSVGSLYAINSIVSDHAGPSSGIHFWSGSGYLELRNCTVTRNAGGGILAPAYGEIRNSILWDNTLGSILSAPSPGLTVDHCVVEGGWTGAGAGNLDADPLFVDPSGGDFRLMPSSPCIDAGDNTVWLFSALSTDRRGAPRLLDDPFTPDSGVGTAPLVDLGAFEFFRRYRRFP